MADNRRAYGLAKEAGIDTKGMTPHEVWEALKKKGISQDSNQGEGFKAKSPESEEKDAFTKKMSSPTFSSDEIRKMREFWGIKGTVSDDKINEILNFFQKDRTDTKRLEDYLKENDLSYKFAKDKPFSKPVKVFEGIAERRARTENKIAKTLNSNLSDSEKKTLRVIQDPESDIRTVVWKTDKVWGDNVDKMYRGKPIYKEAVQRYNPQTGSWKTVEENNISEDYYNDYLDD